MLGLIEHAAVNLRRGWRWPRVQPHDRRAREALSPALGGLPLGLRRSAFGAFRKLLTFLAYADPGVDGPNPRLAAIGYVTDRRPVTPSTRRRSSRLRPAFEHAERRDDPVVLEADVVVVGSGAGGGVVAAALAGAGRSVVVLEAGPFVDERTMPTRRARCLRPDLYLNHGLLSTWDGADHDARRDAASAAGRW